MNRPRPGGYVRDDQFKAGDLVALDLHGSPKHGDGILPMVLMVWIFRLTRKWMPRLNQTEWFPAWAFVM